MDDVFISSHDPTQRTASALLARYDAPAYVRRARKVEDELAALVERCRAPRERYLLMPRILLGALRGQAREWTVLRPFLAADGEFVALDRLMDLLQPRPRLPVPPTTAPRVLAKTLRALIESLQRFNARWPAYLAEVDVTALNALREGYNRYYLLEKECALRNPRLARRGFQPLAPLTAGDLLALLPLLPVPRLAD